MNFFKVNHSMGYKSDCVRFYKRISDELHQVACATIAKREVNAAHFSLFQSLLASA